MPAYFVTGTDTDAGKTLASAGLLARARREGLTTLGLKPIASGSEATPDGMRNADALALQAESVPAPGSLRDPAVAYATINPFAFAPAIAPHLAARRAGVEVRLADLTGWLRPLLALECDLTLVEGAGGWRVPLSAREDLAGLAAAHALPVILVVGLRLGCISQARLTAEAIAHDGLRSEEHTSELQSRPHLVCRLLLEKKKYHEQWPLSQSLPRYLYEPYSAPASPPTAYR